MHPCPKCNGDGKERAAMMGVIGNCTMCFGQGKLEKRVVRCTMCKGDGYVFPSAAHCECCKGTGYAEIRE